MPVEIKLHAVSHLKGLIKEKKPYLVGKSVAVLLCNQKLNRKVPILLHTEQNRWILNCLSVGIRLLCMYVLRNILLPYLLLITLSFYVPTQTLSKMEITMGRRGTYQNFLDLGKNRRY